MATIKAVMRKKKNADGTYTYPLAIRITKKRKPSFIHLGYTLDDPKHWDEEEHRVKKSHPNSKRLNNLIVKRMAEVSDKAIEAETANDNVSSKAIKQKIKPSSDAFFFAQAKVFLQRLRDTGNYNVWNAETPRLRNFKEFILGTEAIKTELSKKSHSHKRPPCKGLFASSDVSFSQIDVGVLTKFKIYLKAQLGLSERTIANYMIVIQAVFSQAIKENITDEKYFPFGKEQIHIKLPETLKVGLSLNNIERLENFEASHPSHGEAVDVWLTSYYFAGMRAADVLQLRWPDFRENRLHYAMDKNGKPGSLKVPEKALKILKRHEATKRHATDFVFSYLKDFKDLDNEFALKKRIASIVCQVDKLLRTRVKPALNIEGSLSMHISRHSFATLAGDKIPVQMLQKLYRHSDIKTTIGYQSNFIHKDADDALDAVINQ